MNPADKPASKPAPKDAAETAPPISSRQWEVLQKVAEVYSYAEAGEFLDITESGIKYHMKRICKALGVKNRREAVRYRPCTHSL
ncbi:MAG: helix-turn-helix transcriptional regulator [Chloroflexota bacterium]